MNVLAFIKQSGLKSYVDKGQMCFFDEQILPDFNADMFNHAYWQNKAAVTGQAHGRGVTYFVKHNMLNMVLRHYYRGGLIAKLINDAYFFTGIENTRPAKEFAILAQIQTWQLPAPRPIAFEVRRRLGFYRANILIEQIPNARDLVGILSNASLSDKLWQKIGQVIRQFHDKNIYHHDLNAHNIMLDDSDKVWLIDFDRAEVRADGDWKQANLDRLLRSFRKELGLIDGFNFSEEQFELLLEGYKAGYKS